MLYGLPKVGLSVMFKIFGFGILRYAARSSKWNKVRKEFLKDNYRCASCGSDNDIEVHHIVPVHVDPSLELDKNNLIPLCAKSCHLLIGHLMDFKSWNVNVVQDCETMRSKINLRPYK